MKSFEDKANGVEDMISELICALREPLDKKKNQGLRRFLRTVLMTVNTLNLSRDKGCTMSSLLKLNQTKSGTKHATLLDVIVEQHSKSEPEGASFDFLECMPVFKRTRGISSVTPALKGLLDGVQASRKEHSLMKDSAEPSYMLLEGFLKVAESRVRTLEAEMDEVAAASRALEDAFALKSDERDIRECIYMFFDMVLDARRNIAEKAEKLRRTQKGEVCQAAIKAVLPKTDLERSGMGAMYLMISKQTPAIIHSDQPRDEEDWPTD
jgi:hypothetical protein